MDYTDEEYDILANAWVSAYMNIGDCMLEAKSAADVIRGTREKIKQSGEDPDSKKNILKTSKAGATRSDRLERRELAKRNRGIRQNSERIRKNNDEKLKKNSKKYYRELGKALDKDSKKGFTRD